MIQIIGPVGPTRHGRPGTLVVAGWYLNGRPALDVIDPNVGVLYHATVNMPDDQIADGYVFPKGWSENEGVPSALAMAGFARMTGRTVEAGHAKAVEAELLFSIEEPDNTSENRKG